MLLRGASASAAAPYRQVAGTTVPPVPRPAPAPAPAGPSPVVASAPEVTVERRTASRRAADVPVPNGRGVLRLGDVYAEELTRLREFARQEGFAAGHAEGVAAAGQVVAEAEAAAAARLADVQARWERRMASATAALAAAVTALEAAAVPTADDVRDTVLDGALGLVEELLGRELSASTSAGLDAVRRALTLVPTDAPAVVRLHPDDLAEIPPHALAALPPTVTVVGDDAVERAGAVAECGPRRVDAQLSTALARVRAVLSGGGPS
ncbi:flagellar assembly protein FliH [Geodermatophilus saharensis]|uniref:Flagellar assembly protein FliH n=1 Tax=Geodermatophilus saharensis TaxID=1137994 RepID=A0A239EZ56_9ACTN|nr:flagellar assembly protein FliH [Geodermatophilus saharensis]